MKKIISCIMALIMISCVFSACSVNNGGNSEKSDKLNIVCTIFPEYDWVSQIVGQSSQSAEVSMLIDNGVDLHSYQPNVDDIIKISDCDVFVYVGGESDSWVKDALKEAKNKNMIVIDLLDILGAAIKEEEVKEGMQEDIDILNDDKEYDEHVWLSVKNAKAICRYISEKICAVDPANADEYKANTEKYISQLSALDEKYTQAVSSAKHNTLLFGDRFPFRYMVDDYGIDYYAAFVGCSSETEASFETIAFLAGKVDEYGLTNVITIDASNHKIADTIIKNTKEKNQKILVLDSMQSITSQDIQNGTTYLSVMEKNFDVLKEALN